MNQKVLISQRRKSFFEKNPKKTAAMVGLILMILLDWASARLYTMILGYPWADRGVKIAEESERAFRTSSAVYHHDLRPNMLFDEARWGSRTYPVATNSLGFKSAEPEKVALESSKRRIVFIGDSFTEGIGVAFENTFVGKIKEYLREKNVEVFNAAAASYSPIIYWRKIKYLIEEVGFKFDEVVVFLDLSDAEDEFKLYALDTAGNVLKQEVLTEEETTIKSVFRENSILFLYLSKIVRDFFLPELAGSQINNPKSAWTFDDRLYDDFGRVGQERMLLYMTKLHELLSEHGVELTIVVYPWPDQILHEDLNSRHVVFWKKWAENHAVGFINYFPYFVNTGQSSANKKQILSEYFIKGDVHWNEAGHDLIAEGFARRKMSLETQ